MINVRDFVFVESMRPFLVAHRGGVIGPDAPENSMLAIQRAAEHGYAMVELDVMEAADGEPVLMHDALFISCGVRKRVCDLTSEELTGLRYRASDEHLVTFADAVAACADLGLGMMLDKLRRDSDSDPDMSPRCMERVKSLIVGAGLESSTVAIVDTPRLRAHLEDVMVFRMRPSDYEQVLAKGTIPKDRFWFGWAADISEEGIIALHESGAFAIVSINTFHYPPHAPYIIACEDIDRLLAAGMDGFQIDSVYEAHFKSRRM
ncbi:MAG TPA: glycerophosphodiester phosphodiesterase family protein [Candidatus Hydrogenedentes bacterium]|nr:glycerophosphodiester phosphodiesterase family protein [Candidatus Hydrogenedentota bacterium]HPG66118.1 glycerophosphodiester phosphodiesterase family protein [Candidatus Hydrogenedentota bacterium]